MKKLIIAAALILATGVLPSYTKQITVKPTEITIAQSPVSIRKDVGTAD
ncbi:hypothetical protein [Mucilaginibacter phyllosphaerae]|uniref:Uncharacterized protein n=1 Tax=Mucilaginibacter phyllosphaerae TaxID=1812349 RepID=A0ABR6I546_9SPHI|nr:hypothetical protein [Mucilaginibacter phyllosphaerae]MBB3967956.1 hypothetical protein [Mucilaginibacter phyllosphaerae]GGH02201.1 hypothetical protein GCM10007352_04290 [Mucilaginibacter phyllosphaerae]